MKKNNKKNNIAQNKKTKKNITAPKSKQQTKSKKVVKKVVKKAAVKKVVKKSVAKKSIVRKDTPKKVEKKKNTVAVKLNKLVGKPAKSSLARSKSPVAQTKKVTPKTKTLTKKTKAKKPITIKAIVKPKSKLSGLKVKLKPVKEKGFQQELPLKFEVDSNESKLNISEEQINNVEDKKISPASQTEQLKKQLLSETELDVYRQKLITMRARLRGDVSTMTDAALNKNRMDASGDLSAVPIHMADVGSDNFEQEQTLSFMQSEHGILIDIEDALIRVKEGTYGICEGCGHPIPKVRLSFIPYVNMCVKCAELVQSEGRND